MPQTGLLVRIGMMTVSLVLLTACGASVKDAVLRAFGPTASLNEQHDRSGNAESRVPAPPRNVGLAALDPDPDPPLAPLGPAAQPSDNPSTGAKVELGRLLFFDPRLSGDASVACADCHQPREGFGTAEPLCRGYPGTVHWRNCPTAVNSGHWDHLFWDGSLSRLERQAEIAAMGVIEGHGSKTITEARLRQVPEYVRRFEDAFGTPMPMLNDAWAAIAAFERVVLTQPSTPLDRYLSGDLQALSPSAVRGMNLFHGKANCIECHNGPMLSDQKFYNLGLADPPEWTTSGLAQISLRYFADVRDTHGEAREALLTDRGRYFATGKLEDMGKFRTPTLRYIAFTPPYMHNGQFYSLEEVVDFYDSGGGANVLLATYQNRASSLIPLNLTPEEKSDLISFLIELSGEPILLERPALPTYHSNVDVDSLSQREAKRAGLPPMYQSAHGQ